MRCVLVGNFGVGNLGDELLKKYFLNQFSDISWTTVSATPRTQEVPRLPLGLRSFFRPWWRTLHAYHTCDGVVFGGGSLFTDTESPFACVLWWWHALIAWMFGKPLLLAFQGIGPFRTRMGMACARWVIRHAVFCSVRDEASAKRVEGWGRTVVRSTDPIVGSVVSGEWKVVSDGGKRFVIIPRQNSGENFFSRVRDVIRKNSFDEIVILSLQPDHRGEKRVCEQLQEEVKDAIIVPIHSLEMLVCEIYRASCVLSQRYHGALTALALKKNVEIVHQTEGDKLASLRESLSNGVSALRIGEETLRSALMRMASPL
ncbi:hypothetical protein A2635_04765 [Candidatus Peribacteria bacterium RIFCSPHIGHO2_01_FULL_51_9]|nr:MAG: hypothetical protein A2635_04765 [Candidatus Peribacteria bacterium RIFCSPHIGHO2_01_FULL_51_9]